MYEEGGLTLREVYAELGHEVGVAGGVPGLQLGQVARPLRVARLSPAGQPSLGAAAGTERERGKRRERIRTRRVK